MHPWIARRAVAPQIRDSEIRELRSGARRATLKRPANPGTRIRRPSRNLESRRESGDSDPGQIMNELVAEMNVNKTGQSLSVHRSLPPSLPPSVSPSLPISLSPRFPPSLPLCLPPSLPPCAPQPPSGWPARSPPRSSAHSLAPVSLRFPARLRLPRSSRADAPGPRGPRRVEAGSEGFRARLCALSCASLPPSRGLGPRRVEAGSEGGRGFQVEGIRECFPASNQSIQPRRGRLRGRARRARRGAAPRVSRLLRAGQG